MRATVVKPAVQLNIFEEEKSRIKTPLDSKAEALYQKYSDKLVMNPSLTRQLVSFQANKKAPFSRWFKYNLAIMSRSQHITTLEGVGPS